MHTHLTRFPIPVSLNKAILQTTDQMGFSWISGFRVQEFKIQKKIGKYYL